MSTRIHRFGLAIAPTCSFLGALLLICAQGAAAVEEAELARFRSGGAQDVPYRGIQTAGRRNSELLPLVVFLHGDWQDCDDNESQLAGHGNGSMQLIDQARRWNIPLVYIAAQTEHGYWPPVRIAAAIADAQKHFPVDPRRILLTGISDGGTGVWDALKAWPACFAGALPMSGMTELAGLGSIRDVPQWVFHGERDNDTDVEAGYGGAMLGSRAVVRALRAMGGQVRHTEYPGEQHVIWHRAYAENGLLVWLLNQRLPGQPCDFAAMGR